MEKKEVSLLHTVNISLCVMLLQYYVQRTARVLKRASSHTHLTVNNTVSHGLILSLTCKRKPLKQEYVSLTLVVHRRWLNKLDSKQTWSYMSCLLYLALSLNIYYAAKDLVVSLRSECGSVATGFNSSKTSRVQVQSKFHFYLVWCFGLLSYSAY